MSIYDDDFDALFVDWDDEQPGDGSLAWLGGLAILISAALVIVVLPWLIVAVLT